MKPAYHFVARSLPLLTPLIDRDACVDLWKRLMLKFPEIAACVLMPNHLHILIYTQKPDSSRLTLGGVLSAWTKKFYAEKSVWTRVPEGRLIPDSHHLKRQIRYVHLNPCRAGFVKDPLSWEWSTHRDYTGCVLSPWPCLSQSAKIFEVPLSKLSLTAHRYISCDPSTSVVGSLLPRSYVPGEPIHAGPTILQETAASVLRAKLTLGKTGPARNLAVHAANSIRLKFSPQDFALTQSGLWRILHQEMEPSGVATVLKCVLDPRLRLAGVSLGVQSSHGNHES